MALSWLLVCVVPALGSFGVWWWRRSSRAPVALFEPLDIGRMLSRVTTVFGREGMPLVLLAILFVGLPRAGWTLALPHVVAGMTGGATNRMAMIYGVGALSGVALSLIGFLFHVPAVLSVCRWFEGEPFDLAAALRRLPSLILPALGMMIIVGVSAFAGMLLFVWPGVLLALGWSVAFPAMLVERTGVLESLRRSRALAIGSRGRILIAYLLFYVVILLLSFLAGFGARLAIGTSPWVAAIVQGGVSVAAAMLSVGFFSSLYVELRQIREGGAMPGLAAVFA